MIYKFPAVNGSLTPLMQIVEGFASDAGCSREQQMNLLLAAEELSVNIINYAYGEVSGDIEMTLEKSGNSILLCFSDTGQPFNPLEAEDPDISMSLDERTPGGLGIYLVKKLAQSLSYRREHGRNIVAADFPCCAGTNQTT